MPPDERRVEILQRHRAVDPLSRRAEARPGDHERHVGGALPERGLVPVALLAEVEAVVRVEHDDGVVGEAALVERVQNAAVSNPAR